MLFAFLFAAQAFAKDKQDEQHRLVALRMIGHELLLASGDSTSRVLPIIREEGHYRIAFANTMVIDPDKLMTTVDRVARETQIAASYIVEVVACDSNQIVYSYEINAAPESNFSPCAGRALPEGCYHVLFSPTDGSMAALDSEPGLPESSGSNPLFYLIPLLLLAGVGGSLFLGKRNKHEGGLTDPNVISLGSYQFDKRNTELIHNDEKIELTAKEADLLVLLYDAVNTTVEREVILNMVWGDQGDYVGRTLDVFISRLRKKLEGNAAVKIVNIRGVGYKLVVNG